MVPGPGFAYWEIELPGFDAVGIPGVLE